MYIRFYRRLLMIIGYARVSTEGQDLSLQLDELKRKGCDKIFSEKQSSRSELPEKAKAFSILDEGDTLVVWKLDRLARSTIELLKDVKCLMDRGVSFVSLKDQIDTTTSGGRFQLAVFAALAELERDMIKERTIAGLEAARARGRVGGRPKGISKRVRLRCESVGVLVKHGQISVQEACRQQGVSKGSYYAWLKQSDKSENP